MQRQDPERKPVDLAAVNREIGHANYLIGRANGFIGKARDAIERVNELIAAYNCDRPETDRLAQIADLDEVDLLEPFELTEPAA
jgi:hypothetical protein